MFLSARCFVRSARGRFGAAQNYMNHETGKIGALLGLAVALSRAPEQTDTAQREIASAPAS
jgi:hypothetical protein